MGDKRRVLFVEDERAIAYLLGETLSDLNVEVITATRVDDGLTAVYDRKPDLIVLDLMLPVKSGWELVKALRADERYADLPIIVYTSRELADEKLAGGLVDEVQEYVTKPRSIMELREVIERYLRLMS